MAKKKFDVDWDRVPLGKVSDVEIAAQIGCSVSLVRLERQKRGKRSRGKRRAAGSARVECSGERLRPTQGWLSMPLAVGERCASCGAVKDQIRLDEDDIGYICKACYFYAPPCSVPGCENISVGRDVCRMHMVGSDISRDEQLARAVLLYGKRETVYPAPGAGYGRKDFMDVIPGKPKEKK